MDFRLLGPVEARADGRVLSLRGTRQRALLAALLLRRGAPVSRDRLLEDLWGEHVPDGAVKALQVAASRLRRALQQEGARLASTPGGYRLLLEPGELDLERFESLAEDGRRALADGQADRASTRLRAALAEWRGPPLADLAFEPFAQTEVVRLEALHAAAVSDRIDADLLAGKHAELVPELETLVLAHPLEERLRAQLILALQRAGRRGDALTAYRQAVRTLDAELGLRPGPELERAQRAVLEDESAAEPSPAAVTAPQRRRATATVLATDLAGLTRIRGELGDEPADAIRRDHDHHVRDALTEHGGREVKALGDGFLAAFESAAAAVTSATAIQRAIDRQAQRGPASFALRVGLAAGDVTWEGGELSGLPVDEAVRLCLAADAGRILVSDTVRLLAGPASELPVEDAGELSLPGFDHPVRAWEVRWDVRRSVVLPLPPALTVDDAPPFAGRGRELDALRDAWQQASAGHRRGVLLAGEPGIGKTRLAAELAAHAASHGAVLLYGRCDDGPAAPAQPFAEALSAYAAACPRDELRAQLGEHAGDLQVIVPSLRARLPDVAEAPPVAPEVERLRTLEAAAALLEAASRPAPVLLVVDDLHWADELSLLLLQHLLRADRPARLLVLATYRDSEPSRTPLMADVVTGLARRPDVARFELAPLTETDVAALLEDAGRGPSLAARVRAVTEGNPFFVGEMIHALDEGADGDPPVTPRVRDVVRWRLARLPAEVGDVLTAAAVAGPEFGVDVIASAAGAGTERVLDALEAAERARLVRPAGVLDRFAFAHALVRQAIIEDLPAGRRVRLHARVAEALERVAQIRSVPAADLAVHFDAAGGLVDAHTTLRHARRAGDEAAGRLAFDIAAEHYDRARRAHARLPDTPAADRLELDVARARTLRLAGDERARDALLEVASDAERAGDGVRMADALVSITLGVATGFLAEDATAIAMLQRALDLIEDRDSAARARAQACLALSAEFVFPTGERRAMADEALAMARRVGEPEALAFALNAHLWIAMEPERRHERLAMAEELARIGPRASPYAECDGHRFRFVSLLEDGDMRRADEALAAARASAHLPVSEWAVCQFDAARAALAGRLVDAERLMLEGVQAALEAGFDPAVVQGAAASMLWCIRRAQGRLGELWEAMPDLDSGPNALAWVHAGIAQVAMARGDERTARRALGIAFDKGVLEMPRGLYWLSTMAGVAEVCAWLGEVNGAEEVDALLQPCADVMSPWTGPVAVSAGPLALALGRRDEAEAHLRGAIALCERTGTLVYLAVAEYELGRMLAPDEEGRRLLAQARASADRLDMPGWVTRADAALAHTRGRAATGP